jgi:hypothetical protein
VAGGSVRRVSRMRLLWVEPEDFLSFGGVTRVTLGPGLTVVTGPNAAGKSNLGRCLDAARAAVCRAAGNAEGSARLDLYEDTGFEGRDQFAIRLGMELDQRWERELACAYTAAALESGADDSSGTLSAEELGKLAALALRPASLEPLFSGVLVVRFSAARRWPWSAEWEFGPDGQRWSVALSGERPATLYPLSARSEAERMGGVRFAKWLLGNDRRGAEAVSMALGDALGRHAYVSYTVQPSSGETRPRARELASLLGMHAEGQSFAFSHVLARVLARGLVLTDNRRLPLQRVFSLAELGRAADLRDGGAVAGELFRLRNGSPAQQARWEQVRESFSGLTGRKLGLRAWPAPGAEGSMIVEPTVTGFHGERLVALSGEGIQEAMVLSALLRARPGVVTVLDEPAVNLEPTAQRRLLGRVRGPGQFLVITHSADLVPFGTPDDLSRIVRVAPTQAGSWVRQPDFTDLTDRDMVRQLALMEPADVRGLLFSAGVVLCEGPTETGALPRWWQAADLGGLPDPVEANVPVISVGGDAHFGAYLRFLEAFGVPWTVVADGPALRPDSRLSADLRATGCYPKGAEPGDGAAFAVWRDFWESGGVFTFADQFGDDGNKAGEFEAFLSRTDAALFAKAQREAGRSKPRAGVFFALDCPAPAEVVSVYKKIARRLGVRA